MMAFKAEEMKDINSIINEVSELTEEEKIILVKAMKQAQELDAQERNKMSRPLEGQLYKYTNVVKGWQYRWFILIPETGILEYYMLDEVKKKRPRGAIFLAGAVISPSDEDGQSFAISAACGELYKLRANDPKERQFWVNRIRAVAEQHTKNIAEKNPPLPPREHRSPLSAIDMRVHGSSEPLSTWYTNAHPTRRRSVRRARNDPLQPRMSATGKYQGCQSVTDALNYARDMLQRTEAANGMLAKLIEALPHAGNNPKCCDTSLLLLKATSAATVNTLKQLYSILQHQQVSVNFPKPSISFPLKSEEAPSDQSLTVVEHSSTPTRSRETSVSVDPTGEVSDDEVSESKESSIEGDSHTLIVNLMSRLKLGTDLTNVCLPSHVLEPRSLLELFADSFKHSDLLVRIVECSSPETRMLAVVKWYLSSFYPGKESLAAKKPYNPIRGETFRCSWNLCDNQESESSENVYKLTYVAEQVSHHPPVSAFYVECPKKKIAINAHICVKSNFMTSYAVVNFIGEVNLHLLSFDETYSFTFPCAYIRNVLSVPWVELGGRVSVNCLQSEYTSAVTFQTKPPQSGIPHKICGEIKHAEDTLYKISGEWNNILHFIRNDGSTEIMSMKKLKNYHKHVRPIDQQDAFESRKLWQQVTNALSEENYGKAEMEKQKLENHQREAESKYLNSGTQYNSKLFHKENEIWQYKYPLT